MSLGGDRRHQRENREGELLYIEYSYIKFSKQIKNYD